VNCINLNKFFKRTQAKYLLNILFLIGFLIIGSKLENYLYAFDDYYDSPNPSYKELVFSEQPEEKILLVTDLSSDSDSEDILGNVCKGELIHSYKIAIHSYNQLILTKYKVAISNPIFNSGIISVLQSNNIWHKSSEEEPGSVSS